METEVKVNPVNYTRRIDVLGSGSIDPRILNLGTKQRSVSLSGCFNPQSTGYGVPE
jgi:hypothetical protein